MMLLTKGKEKILRIFYSHPTTEIHQREISRLANVPIQNAYIYLNEFIELNFIAKRSLPNIAFYKVNFENPAILKIFELFEVVRRLKFFKDNPEIARPLKDNANMIKNFSLSILIIIVFGSITRGESRPDSDIDLLVVISPEADKDGIKKGITKTIRKAKPILNLSPVVIDLNQYKTGLEEKNDFFSELWEDRVVIYNEFLFWQIIAEGGLKVG